MITEVDLDGTPCFAPNARLSDLKAVNFIFGPNGSGKTTLTRRLGNKDTNGNKSAHVYNHDYVKSIFFSQPTGTEGELPGITFTLGTKDADKQRELQELLKKIDELTGKLDGTANSAGQRQQLDTSITEYTVAKRLLKQDLKAVWLPHTAADSLLRGHKQDAEKLASRLLEYKDEEPETLTLTELSQRYETLANQVTSPIRNDLPATIPNKAWFNEVQQELLKPIVFTSTSPLLPIAKELSLLPWIKEGYDRTSHAETLSRRCPYCQQHMSDELIEQIRSLFDTSSQEQLSKLERTLETITNLERSLRASTTTINSTPLINEHAVSESISIVSQFTLDLQAIEEAIRFRLEEPSGELPQFQTISEIPTIESSLNLLKDRIDEHNLSIQNRWDNRNKYGNRFYIRLYQDCEEIIRKRFTRGTEPKRKEIEGIKKSIQNKETQLKSLESRIRVLRDELSDTTEVRASINTTLEHLGFVRFRLGQSPNNRKLFTIERPIKDAPLEYSIDRFDTLSEGEKTILSFLYFMHCIKPDSNELDNTQSVTLVIDDPIASTDASTFYFITALMRRAVRRITEPDNRELQNEISNKVDQVVILTHNVGFYSNSSYEIRRQLKRKSIAEMTAFFQLEKSFEIGKPHQIHSIENPDSISTEYQLLWNEVFQASKECEHYPSDTIIPSYRLLSNTLRRILDSYFITLGTTNHADARRSSKSSITRLGQSYGQVVEECMIRLNEGSHGSYENYTSSTLSTRQLLLQFERIFSDLIDNGAHHGHFLMMMGLPSGGKISDLWEDGQEEDKTPVDSSALAD
jgi:hypothetical protein